MTVTALSYDGQFALSLLADNNLPDLPILAAGVRGGIGGLYQRSPGDGPLGMPPPSRSAASRVGSSPLLDIEQHRSPLLEGRPSARRATTANDDAPPSPPVLTLGGAQTMINPSAAGRPDFDDSPERHFEAIR
jgi:hypothetical protein